MQRTLARRTHRLAVAITATLISACGLDKQTQPSLIGPADTAQSIQMTASPDQLPRDGNSQSIVTVIARDPSNRPIVGQRLIQGFTDIFLGWAGDVLRARLVETRRCRFLLKGSLFLLERRDSRR